MEHKEPQNRENDSETQEKEEYSFNARRRLKTRQAPERSGGIWL